MRVVVLATHPEVAPSTRFRVDQYRERLSRQGIHLVYEFLFDREEYRSVRSSVTAATKGRQLARALARRRRLLRRRLDADLVWVEREMAPILQSTLMSYLHGQGVPILYDYDDAVFLHRPGGSRILRGLANPWESTTRLCRLASVVLAGNEFLADFALHARTGLAGLHDPVRVLPTVIDTARFVPGPPGSAEKPVVGWVGSHTTLPYLLERGPALQRLARHRPFTLRVVSNEEPPAIPGVDVAFVPWTPEGEVSVFHGLDVGVYPVRNDHWARGKCGFKAIEYAACGLPVIASPVGVLRDMVIPEETGLWAETDGEWCEALDRVLERPDLGRRWGANGRALVEDKFSIDAGLPILVNAMKDAVGEARGPDGRTAENEEPCVASPVS